MTEFCSNTVQIQIAARQPVLIPLSVAFDAELTSNVEDVHSILRKAFKRDGGDARLYERLVRSAEVLTNRLLTSNQRQQLAELSPGVAVAIHAPLALQQIPWELLRVEGEFLGERFAVGRLGAKDSEPHSDAADASDGLPRPAAVVIPESWELVNTNTERTIVERRLRQLSHDFPTRLQAPVRQLARHGINDLLVTIQQAGWLHFAGHATLVDGVRCLSLESDRRAAHAAGNSPESYFTPQALQQCLTAPESVFLNACGALQLPPPGHDAQNAVSLVSEFLRLGTKWLIGPVVPVLDGQTRHFTTEFYDCMLQSCSIGESLRRARLQARRKLKPHNLLPLSYVLYGDPSSSPFPMSESMPAFHPAQPTPTAAPISFPCNCHQCGRTIETRHGIGRRESGTAETFVICRDCHRQTLSDVPRDSSLIVPVAEMKVRTQAVQRINSSSAGKPAKSSTVPESPVVRGFRQHVDECLSRPGSWLNLKTGEQQTCTFRPAQTSDVSPLGNKLTQLDRSASEHPSEWSGHYLVRDAGNRALAKVTMLIPGQTVTNETSPMTADAVSQAAADHVNDQPAIHHYLFLCSPTGFNETCLAQLAAPSAPSWYGSGCTVYLHDISTNQTHFRGTDLSACQLADVLQRESTGRQFEQAVNWIEAQLPLVVSLNNDHIARQLSLETDAVDAALRFVAFKRQLCLDHTPGFGLVLSEPDPTKLSGVPSTPKSFWQWPKKAARTLLLPVVLLIQFFRRRKDRVAFRSAKERPSAKH